MNSLPPALAYAAAVWWLSTGVLLWLDRRPARTFRTSLIGATFVLLCSLYVLWLTRADASLVGAYAGFTAAVLIWGWVEMAFLMGFITGPRNRPCPAECRGWRRALYAVQTILYHELALLAAALVIALLTRDAANQTAWWTFVVLWTMRVSAKLNLFLGAPNLGESALPEHLRYLSSYFRRRPMNFLFPLSVTAATIAAALLFQRALTAAEPFSAAQAALLASLLALAVLEHWFMVLPWPSERLWRWSLRPQSNASVEIERAVTRGSSPL